MKKGENSNRPATGSKIKVEPIRKLKDVKTIKKLLAHKPLDLALFTVGINTNLRASDLLQIKVKQVKGLKPGETIELREKKTDKIRQITLNGACIETIQNLLRSRKYKSDEDSLFTGKRGPLTVPAVHLKVKSWCRQINLKGNYGSHTLRKTWGYHQYHTFKQPLPLLMECFNHSTQKQTLNYLCIQAEEIQSVYMNEL
jgi:integrase